MRRLNILFVTPWYPSRENPIAGVFVQEHAKAAQLHDDVVVFHSQRRADLRGLWRIVPERDEALSAGLPTYHVLHRQVPLPNLSFFVELGSVLHGLRHLRHQGFIPDIVHGHTYTAGAVSVVLAKLLHIPAIVTEHSTEFPRKLVRGAGVWKARLAFSQAAMVLPVSLSLQRAIEAYNIEARFRIIPNVVDTDLFYPSLRPHHPRKRLLTVAQLELTHKKGIPVLLEALAQLQTQRSDWQLDIIGDGPARAECEQLSRDLHLTDSVRFHGTVLKPGVAQLMREADLFVLPSRFETFSVATAEALATGLPVLVTKCGGPEEYITPEIGMTIPVNDVESLCGALNTMLDTLDMYPPNDIANYARTRFSSLAVGSMLHDTYLEVTGVPDERELRSAAC